VLNTVRARLSSHVKPFLYVGQTNIYAICPVSTSLMKLVPQSSACPPPLSAVSLFAFLIAGLACKHAN